MEFRTETWGGPTSIPGGVGTQHRANPGVLALYPPQWTADFRHPALHTEKIITRYVFTVRYNLQSDGTPHVLEGSLFLIISAELRAKQLARRRAPCIEILFSILLEGLPTVDATVGSVLDGEAADETYHILSLGAEQRICSLPPWKYHHATGASLRLGSLMTTSAGTGIHSPLVDSKRVQ